MKKILTISSVACFILLFSFVPSSNMMEDDIWIDKIELAKNHRYYDQIINYSSDSLSNFGVTKNVINSLPNSLPLFRFKRTEENQQLLKSCEIKLLNLWKEYRTKSKEQNKSPVKSEFLNKWEEKYGECFGIYRKLAPRLYFELETSLKHSQTEFQLKELVIKNLYFTKSKSPGWLQRTALVDISLSSTTESQVIPIRGSSFILKGAHGLEFKLWSDHYNQTNPGQIPPKELYIVSLYMAFEQVHTNNTFKTKPKYFAIEI